MCVCLFVLQMRGRTPNTLPGRDLQMERWPSGGRVYQVTHIHGPVRVHFVLCDLSSPSSLFCCLLVLLCVKHTVKIMGLKIERTQTSANCRCFISVWPAWRCLQSQFISSHLELMAYLQLVSERCNQNFCLNVSVTTNNFYCITHLGQSVRAERQDLWSQLEEPVRLDRALKSFKVTVRSDL